MKKILITLIVSLFTTYSYSQQTTSSVILELITNEEGKVTNVSLIKSSGDKESDETAILIGKNTKFLPTIINNEKVKIKTNLQLTFDSTNSKKLSTNNFTTTYNSIRPLNLTLKVISEPNINDCYPSFSKRAGEKGLVILNVEVNEDGTVYSSEIKDSSGFVRLDKAAQNCVKQYVFETPIINNKSVRVKGPMWIRFNLI